MIGRDSKLFAGLSCCFHAVSLGVLLALLSPPAQAQTQTYQTWPEVDTYITLNQNFRLYFIATQTRENGQGTTAEIAANLDFFFKPLFRRNKLVIYQPDQAKSRLFLLRAGYHYLPSIDGPTEHRGVLEVTGRYPLKSWLLFSDRNRTEFRFINGEFSWRYRNRPSMERTVSIGSYHFTPYVRGEVYFDSNNRKWSRTSEDLGAAFPIRKHTEIEFYYEHQNDTSKSPNRQTSALGLSLNLYF
ncbi:MAG TPA: DUF2490 domain-containing protein [Candidatus Sulfotelmatobacter sp.]|nr:DUF2490 domain-containing protein [Candidatus Sulfotelmatobacter sp.]